MRELVIARLKAVIEIDPEYGIPRCFDCDDDDNITDPEELDSMTDEELLDVFESVIGFQG